MTSKSRQVSARKNPGATRANARDRRLLERAAEEDAEGCGEPSSTLRSIKAAAPAASAAEAEYSAFQRESARAKALGATNVPVTLRDICSLIAHDVKPERFAATALTELAAQMEIIAEAAEGSEFNGYEAWKFTQNLIKRMRLAGRVTAWLESGTPTALPEVEP
jgi:hypothetical protein